MPSSVSEVGWNIYITNLITASNGQCDRVTLIGLDRGSHWTDPHHPQAVALLEKEAVTIAHAMDTLDDTAFEQRGVCLNGVNYHYVRRSGNLVFAKKKGCGGVTLGSSRKCVIVAHTGEGKHQSFTNRAVDNSLADGKGHLEPEIFAVKVEPGQISWTVQWMRTTHGDLCFSKDLNGTIFWPPRQ